MGGRGEGTQPAACRPVADVWPRALACYEMLPQSCQSSWALLVSIYVLQAFMKPVVVFKAILEPQILDANFPDDSILAAYCLFLCIH